MKKVYEVVVYIKPTEKHVIELVADSLHRARVLSAHSCGKSVNDILSMVCINTDYDGPDYIKTIDRIRL